MEHMVHHTLLVLDQIQPHTLGLIMYPLILKAVTLQKFQALTDPLVTAQPQSLVGYIPSRTVRQKHLHSGVRFQDILLHR